MHRSHLVLNIALIVVTLIFGVVFFERYLVQKTDPADSPTASAIGPGATLTLRDVDWSKSNQTLVLALSKHCRFCTEGAGFYRDVMQELKGQTGIRTLAIFSESLSEAQQYLKEINVSVDEVRQVSLKALGLKGTPTILLVNGSGEISKLWLGQLSTKQQTEVMSSIGAKPDGEGPARNIDALPDQINEDELQRITKSGRRVVILDVREREQFAQGHVEGAKNIPIGELSVRAINELSPDDFIVTSCQCTDATMSKTARDQLLKSGFKNVAVLQ